MTGDKQETRSNITVTTLSDWATYWQGLTLLCAEQRLAQISLLPSVHRQLASERDKTDLPITQQQLDM